MEKMTQIGKTDLHVHPIGLGAMPVGGQNLFPSMDEKTSKEIMTTALRNGINFIDTAFFYGFGHSEELVGEAIKQEKKRHDVVLATKAAHDFYGNEPNEYVMNNRPDFLKQAVDDALRRLQTDYLDLFYIHDPDEDTPGYEAVGALKELKDAGKIRAIGLSNFTPDQLKEANRDGYVDVYQGPYNLIQREAENDYFPYAKEQGISFVPYFPFASGILAGKYDKSMTFSDLRANMPHLKGKAFKKNLDKVEKIRPIAVEKQVDVAHVVLAWYLTQSPIDAVIPGAKRPQQVLNNLKAAEVELSANDVQTIDDVFSAES